MSSIYVFKLISCLISKGAIGYFFLPTIKHMSIDLLYGMITLLSPTDFTGIYALSSDEWKSTQSWSETINSGRFGAFVPVFIHMEEHVIFKWHEQLYCSKVCCQSQWCLFFFSWISCSRYRLFFNICWYFLFKHVT